MLATWGHSTDEEEGSEEEEEAIALMARSETEYDEIKRQPDSPQEQGKWLKQN